jgi:hypothetical protein
VTLVRTAGYVVLGGFLIAFAVWLVLPFGKSWILDIIAALIGWEGFDIIGTGLEHLAGRHARGKDTAA